MANNVDPDQMPLTVASDLGEHGLFRPFCPNTLVKYGIRCLFRSCVLPCHLRQKLCKECGLASVLNAKRFIW